MPARLHAIAVARTARRVDEPRIEPRRGVDHLLQQPASPSGARLRDPDGGLVPRRYRCGRRPGCGHDGQRKSGQAIGPIDLWWSMPSPLSLRPQRPKPHRQPALSSAARRQQQVSPAAASRGHPRSPGADGASTRTFNDLPLCCIYIGPMRGLVLDTRRGAYSTPAQPGWGKVEIDIAIEAGLGHRLYDN
jgi:hypothetical protein